MICAKKSVNPKTRFNEKLADILQLVGKFGFSSPECITFATGAQSHGFGERLHKKKLLTRRDVAGLVIAGKAVTRIYGLSKQGAQLVGLEPKDIWKVSVPRMAHTLVAQKIALKAFHEQIIPCSGLAIDLRVEEQCRDSPYRYDLTLLCESIYDDEDDEYGDNAQNPDAVHVEIELSGKYGAVLDLFFLKLGAKKVLVYFLDSKLMARYLDKLSKYSREGFMKTWSKKSDGTYVEELNIKFSDLDFSGVFFRCGDEVIDIDQYLYELKIARQKNQNLTHT